MAGAIEQQIGLEIFRHVFRDGVDPVDHGVDHAVGKPRHRHGQGIDELLLRRPLGSDGVGDLPARHDHLAAGRRADRLVIQRNAKSPRRFGDAGARVKALPPRRARRAPNQFLRIERRGSGRFFEQFTHALFGFGWSAISRAPEYDKIERQIKLMRRTADVSRPAQKPRSPIIDWRRTVNRPRVRSGRARWLPRHRGTC